MSKNNDQELTTPTEATDVAGVGCAAPSGSDGSALQAKWDKYHAIKKRMRGGEMVPREEFMFVKLWDQRGNAFRSRTRGRVNAMLKMGPQCHGPGLIQ